MEVLLTRSLKLDEQRKKLQLEFDNTQAKINSSSKEIGQLMAKGEKEKAEALKQTVPSLKTLFSQSVISYLKLKNNCRMN